MHNDVLIALAAIAVLGVGLQWLAWRLRLPVILLLLIAGFVAGPVTGVLDPDRLLGDLLLPVVAISTAIILFEGGLGLNLAELRHIGKDLFLLVSIGAAVTGLIAFAAATLIFEADWQIAALLSAILIVTGPTVIGPLLRHVRVTGRSGTLLKWEGILIDPIGAVAAVLVFEAVLESSEDTANAVAALLLQSIGIGVGVGLAAAGILVLLLRRYLVPDYLHNAVSLALVVLAFTVSAELLDEAAGLLAVTIMGIALANQRWTPVRHIIEFEETLRTLLISGLFILLASRLTIDDITRAGWRSLIFLGVLVVVARPLAVLASTMRSSLPWRERAFIAWMAPRGIVAAAVSSIFAIRLAEADFAGADLLVPATFAVIVGTIVVYGSTSSFVAKRLGLSEPNPQGILFVGAHSWARQIASVLHGEGVKVMLADTDWGNIAAARLQGLPAYFGSILSEHALNEIELNGIGRLTAWTSNDHLNALAAQHFIHIFGRASVYQLPPRTTGEHSRREALSHHQRARLLFGDGVTYAMLAERFAGGATVKKNKLTKEFTLEAFKERYGESALPLFLLSDTGALTVFATDGKPTPKAGQTIISIIGPDIPPPPEERVEATDRGGEEPEQAAAPAPVAD